MSLSDFVTIGVLCIVTFYTVFGSYLILTSDQEDTKTKKSDKDVNG